MRTTRLENLLHHLPQLIHFHREHTAISTPVAVRLN